MVSTALRDRAACLTRLFAAGSWRAPMTSAIRTSSRRRAHRCRALCSKRKTRAIHSRSRHRCRPPRTRSRCNPWVGTRGRLVAARGRAAAQVRHGGSRRRRSSQSKAGSRRNFSSDCSPKPGACRFTLGNPRVTSECTHAIREITPRSRKCGIGARELLVRCLQMRGGNPGDIMADAARQLLDSEPAHEPTCRHARVFSCIQRTNVSSVRCRDCGHNWIEVHPPRTAMMMAAVHGPPLPKWGSPRLARR